MSKAKKKAKPKKRTPTERIMRAIGALDLKVYLLEREMERATNAACSAYGLCEEAVKHMTNTFGNTKVGRGIRHDLYDLHLKLESIQKEIAGLKK